MAKFVYPIVENYCSDWTLRDAIREMIANGLDAEIEKSAPCTIRHAKETITIVNKGTRLDVSAFYFGGSSKHTDTRLIGQYGEGLKLALLVFARLGVDARIINDNESWSVGFEKDQNGVDCFHIYTRALKNPTGEVRVEIPGVDNDAWDLIERMFLRLRPPENTIPTSHGTILLDPDHVGTRYAKGVFIDRQPGSTFGYDFKTLNVGRDRRSHKAAEAMQRISWMWEEAVQKGNTVERIYLAMENSAEEFSMVQYYATSDFVSRMVAHFHELHGDDAYPVLSTAEGLQLEHLGLRPVTLPRNLVEFLRKGLPTIPDLVFARARSVTRRYRADELTDDERAVLGAVLDMRRTLGIAVTPDVVDFKEPSIEGTYQEGEVRLARKVLGRFGKALGVFLHEAAHAQGADAEKSHLDAIHEHMEAAFDVLYKNAKGA